MPGRPSESIAILPVESLSLIMGCGARKLCCNRVDIGNE